MYKAHVLFYGIVAVCLTLYGLLEPGYYIDLLVSSSGGFAVIRTLVIAFMLAYVFRQEVRNLFYRNVMRSLGITMLVFGLTTFFSPTFFGQFPKHVPIGDMLLFIEGGVLGLLISLELPVQKTAFAHSNIKYLSALLAVQPRKLLSALKH